MTFEDFSREVNFSFEEPKDYTHCVVTFNDKKTEQEFYFYAYEKIPNLKNLWAFKSGNSFYMAVENTVSIPEDFADYIDIAEFTDANKATDAGEDE
jgi:hypothetical protein